jgi:hypothetical protein
VFLWLARSGDIKPSFHKLFLCAPVVCLRLLHVDRFFIHKCGGIFQPAGFVQPPDVLRCYQAASVGQV